MGFSLFIHAHFYLITSPVFWIPAYAGMTGGFIVFGLFMSDLLIKKLASCLGFITLVCAALALELNGKPAAGLWVFIVFWACFL